MIEIYLKPMESGETNVMRYLYCFKTLTIFKICLLKIICKIQFVWKRVDNVCYFYLFLYFRVIHCAIIFECKKIITQLYQ